MVTLTLNAFYQALPITSPATYTLTYTLDWDSTEGWTDVDVLVWGPQGVATDTFTPSLSNVTLTQGGVTVTRTVTVTQTATYTPLVQDGTFQTGTPWTITNGTLTPGSVALNLNGTITQNIVLQPGTYKVNVTADAAVTLTLNGLNYSNNTAITVDDTPLALKITAAATLVHVTSVGITGTPSFPIIPPPTQSEFPIVPPAASFPLYVVACDQNDVVQSAIYLTNVAPAQGSPQTLTSPVEVTQLTSALVPVAQPPLQPSSGLNN